MRPTSSSSARLRRSVLTHRRRSPAALVLTIGLAALRASAQDPGLTTATSSLFSGSGNCAVCHESSRGALVDARGVDVSIATHWRATMMAHAAKDPLWQAKVEAEVAAAPALAAVIEDKCTTCHAPMGRTQAIADGEAGYHLDSMRSSPLALDGVSCTMCHQIRDVALGEDASFSGGYVIGTDRSIYGPYADIFGNPMVNQTGYTPRFADHTGRSELCATCHTLFTPVLSSEGEIVGTFPEQTPYLEWLASEYPAEGTECQTCHMPIASGAVRISNRPPFVAAQEPFFRHEFVGGNTYMLGLLETRAAAGETSATAAQLRAQGDRTRAGLREGTAGLAAEARVEGETLTILVDVENRTGHKLPTGFPGRRVWIRLEVEDRDGRALFRSGAFDAAGRIEGLGSPLEAHHEVIDAEEMVQVYESVIADLDGEVTYTLLRAASYAKDNRIPPRGHRPGAPGTEDIGVFGAAATDADYVPAGGAPAAGRDRVEYRVDVSEGPGPYRITIDLLFQSVPPRLVDDLRRYETPAVERLLALTEAADASPDLIGSLSLDVSGPGGADPLFRRGDVNADDRLDISDAVATLLFLFSGGGAPPCPDSADIDDDGKIAITDAVRILSHLFQGGGAPEEPYSECGPDPTPDDDLGCASFPPCE